jgi:hypothetical protein
VPGTVDELGEDQLDDGVTAVLAFGGHERERPVGERAVVAPDRKQRALLVDHSVVQVGDPAHEGCGAVWRGGEWVWLARHGGDGVGDGLQCRL